MKEGEVDGGSSDGSDHEEASSAAPPPSVSRVSSSTNGNGTGVSVISGPLQLRSFEDVTRAHIVGNALVALGAEVIAATNAGLTSPFAAGGDATSNRLSSFLSDLQARSASGATSKSSNKSSNGSDVSNSASPLSLNVVSGGKPKPRAADSPGSGSTTSTTTGVGTPGRDKVFTCPICNRSFGYKHVLQNHERTHTGEKPFECRECHKRFTRDHHLKTHMRLHTGEKPYHCDHCDRQFVQVANLRRHLRVHTGERPYACQLCTSRFSDSNQLKAHMLIHKGEKPFECAKCLGRFRRRHHLMHHKCPKDEANLGKPRRGRRPKAYDNLSPTLLSLQRTSPTGSDAMPSMSAVSSSTAVLAAAASSSVLPNAFFPFQAAGLALPGIPGLPPLPAPHRDLLSSLTPPVAHGTTQLDSTRSKSRRKQRQTTRILTPQQRELFLQDRTSMQTQPLNMSVSPNIRKSMPPSQEVLDLSRSRSDDADSEAEAIEEDVDEMEEHEYESDHYDEEEEDDEDARQPSLISASPRLHRSLLPGVPIANLPVPMRAGHLSIVTDKLTDVAQDIRMKKLSLQKKHDRSVDRDEHNSSDDGQVGNGENGSIKNEPDESTSTSNGNGGLHRKPHSKQAAC